MKPLDYISIVGLIVFVGGSIDGSARFTEIFAENAYL